MSELPPQDPVSATPATPVTSTSSFPATTTTTPAYAAPNLGTVPEPADLEKNKVLAIFSYIGLLVLIPLLAAKDSPFARYHANQGLILLICAFIGSVVILPVSIVLAFVPFVGACLAPIAGLGWSLCILAMMILGIVNVVNGKMVPLPVIGKFKILK